MIQLWKGCESHTINTHSVEHRSSFCPQEWLAREIMVPAARPKTKSVIKSGFEWSSTQQLWLNLNESSQQLCVEFLACLIPNRPHLP
ncbi:hypothetical protein Peur_044561 [Populus x canadensis]